MNALATLRRANAAGLVLEPVAGGLRVQGPRQVRAALRSELAAAAEEIMVLLGRAAGSPFMSTAQECVECRRTDWIVSVVMDDGSRVCSGCRIGRAAR